MSDLVVQYVEDMAEVEKQKLLVDHTNTPRVGAGLCQLCGLLMV
jgi:hypothetical protein